MERGITHDLEFESWANLVHTYEGDSLMDLAGYKKELTLEVMNEKGQVALRYFLHACWVSEYTAVPDLDANANAVAITAGVSGAATTGGSSAGASGGRHDATTVGDYYKGMATFTVAKGGLMYEASIGGAGFTYDPL